MLQIRLNPHAKDIKAESMIYFEKFALAIEQHSQEIYLTNPGLYLRSKTVLETFCFAAPTILALSDTVNQIYNVSYGGVLKDIPNWLSVTFDQSDLTYYFNEEWGKKAAFTEIDPVEFSILGLAVMKYIETTSLEQTMNLIKSFFGEDVALAPVSLYSELFNFTVEFRGKFKKSKIEWERQSSYEFMNLNVQGKLVLRDVFGTAFPSFFTADLQGTTLADIARQMEGLEANLEKGYVDMSRDDAELRKIVIEIENMIDECNRVTAYVAETEENKNSINGMKEERIENIPSSIIELNQKVENITNGGELIEKQARKIVEKELPIIIAALKGDPETSKEIHREAGQRKTIIDTGKLFFFNMIKGINKQVPKLKIEELNRLPMDVMLSINLVYNTSQLNLHKLKAYLSSTMIQLVKMGAESNNVPEIEQYIKIRNEKASEMFMNYIKSPMQQIEILRAKGERLLNAQQQSNEMKNSLKTIFGEFSQTSTMMANQFSQVQMHLTALTEQLEDNRMQLAGLTPTIEKSIRQQFEGFEIKFSNTMNSEIGKITTLLSNAQITTNTSFERFSNEMINLSKGMQMVLSSLTSISKQIEELNSTTQIIKGLTETSVQKQDFILKKLEEFIQRVAEKGLEGLYTTKNNAVEDLKLFYNENKRKLEEVKIEREKNLSGMEGMFQKIENSRNEVDKNIDMALNRISTEKWDDLRIAAEKIPLQIKRIGEGLNMTEQMQKVENEAVRLKQSIENGFGIDSVLKKINEQRLKIQGIDVNMSTSDLENKITGERGKIERMALNMPNLTPIEEKMIKQSEAIERMNNQRPNLTELENRNLLERNEINRMILAKKTFQEEISKEIDRLNSMDLELIKIAQTVTGKQGKNLVTHMDELTNGILRNIEILNPHFKNSPGISVVEKLDNLENNLKLLADSIMASGSGGGGGGDDERKKNMELNDRIIILKKEKQTSDNEIDLLKNKMLAMNNNVGVLSSTIMKLMDEIYRFFLKESKFQIAIVNELIENGIIKETEYVEHIVKQIEENHKIKLANLFEAVEKKLPLPRYLERDNDVDLAIIETLQYAQEKYGPNVTSRNEVDFNWWKRNEKLMSRNKYKRRDNIETPSPPDFEYNTKDDKVIM